MQKAKFLDDFQNNNVPLTVLMTCTQLLHEMDYLYLDRACFVDCNITPIDSTQVVEKTLSEWMHSNIYN